MIPVVNPNLVRSYEKRAYHGNAVTVQRLEYMVVASCGMCDFSGQLYAAMQEGKHANNRTRVIRWIKEVASLSGISSDARDTSIQIFDRYFGQRIRQRQQYAFCDSHEFSAVAAVSVLLSSKFHESRPLSMTSFSSLSPEALSSVENQVLEALNYDIVPLATPTSFIHHMLLLWPNPEKDTNLIALIDNMSCKIVAEFWENTASSRYGPSTIALASLLLAFSSQRVDCSRWLLECIPDVCLPREDSDIFGSNALDLLDIDGCLSNMQMHFCSHEKVPPGPPNSHNKTSRDDSPVSIPDAFRTATPVAETAAISLSEEPCDTETTSDPVFDNKINRPGKRVRLF